MKQKDILAFIGLSISWGASFYCVKVALQELGPFTLVAERLLLGGISLALIALFRKVALPTKHAQWAALAVVGMTNVAIPFVVTTWGQIFIDSAVAAILLSTVPLFTVVIAHFALHDDKITWVRALGIAAGFVGVVIILSRDLGGMSSTFWGFVSQLFGALLYGATTVFARRTLQGVSVILQALIPIAMADLLLWIFVPVFESPIALPHSPLVIGAMLFLGLVCSCFAYLFYYYLIHSIGPTRTSMIAYIFPLIGVALGVIFLKELIDLRLVAGAALVLGSVFIVNRA